MNIWSYKCVHYEFIHSNRLSASNNLRLRIRETRGVFHLVEFRCRDASPTSNSSVSEEISTKSTISYQIDFTVEIGINFQTIDRLQINHLAVRYCIGCSIYLKGKFRRLGKCDIRSLKGGNRNEVIIPDIRN